MKRPAYRRMRYSSRFLGALLCTVLCLAASAAFAFPRVDVEGTAQTDSGSQTNITHVFAFTAYAINPFVGQSLAYPVECIFFNNASPTPAKHYRFYFVYTASEGADAGKVVGKDFIDVRGSFGTGIAQETWPLRQAPVPGKQCRDLPGDIRGGRMWYAEKKVYVTLSAYVSEVEYSDGTSWKAAAPPPTTNP